MSGMPNFAVAGSAAVGTACSSSRVDNGGALEVDPAAAYCPLCKRVHQGRERLVMCRICATRLTGNFHAVCPVCWPDFEREETHP